MKKSGVVLSLAAATTLTGVVVPSSAQAVSSSANPSCAAFWAHLQQEGFVPNLGQANKILKDMGYKGFAKAIASEKYNDGYCYGE